MTARDLENCIPKGCGRSQTAPTGGIALCPSFPTQISILHFAFVLRIQYIRPTDRCDRRLDPKMRGAALTALIAGWLLLSISSGSPQSASTQKVFLDKYCLTCHNENAKAKGVVPVAFEKLDLSNISKDAETWEKVVRKV